jgi:hypothetical protein
VDEQRRGPKGIVANFFIAATVDVAVAALLDVRASRQAQDRPLSLRGSGAPIVLLANAGCSVGYFDHLADSHNFGEGVRFGAASNDRSGHSWCWNSLRP